MKKLILLILVFNFISNVSGQQAGNLSGVVIDASTKEPLPGVNIILKGTYHGAASDINGAFRIDNIPAGKYNIDVSLIGYKTFQYTGVEIETNKTKQLNVDLEETVLTLDQDVVVIGDKPLLDPEETQSKRTITKEDIESLVVENIQNIVTQQTGVVTADNEINIRGGRTYENAFLLDGVSGKSVV